MNLAAGLTVVPVAIGAVVGLLMLAAHLERRAVLTTVRLASRSRSSLEDTEALVATSLAPVLLAAGLDRRVATAVLRPEPLAGAENLSQSPSRRPGVCRP
jgi:hypothetical protein